LLHLQLPQIYETVMDDGSGTSKIILQSVLEAIWGSWNEADSLPWTRLGELTALRNPISPVFPYLGGLRFAAGTPE